MTLYEPRGDYQLILESMQPAGEGLLQQRFELLKQTLSAQGLFDIIHKNHYLAQLNPSVSLPRQRVQPYMIF